MARRKNFVQVTQSAGDVTCDVQDKDAVLRGHRFVQVVKCDGCQAVKSGSGDSLDCGRAGQGLQNTHLTEKVAGTKDGEFEFAWLAKMFADANLSFTNHEKTVSSFPLANDDLTRCSFDFFGTLPEQIQGGFVQSCENRHVL